jgi:hypothetical protein
MPSGTATSANDRHSAMTGHRAQIALAAAIRTNAGPSSPTGKNISGSAERHAARSRQPRSATGVVPLAAGLRPPGRPLDWPLWTVVIQVLLPCIMVISSITSK